jgi:hypothetical protein
MLEKLNHENAVLKQQIAHLEAEGERKGKECSEKERLINEMMGKLEVLSREEKRLAAGIAEERSKS